MYIPFKNSISPKSIFATVYFKLNSEYIGKKICCIYLLWGDNKSPLPIVCNSYCAIFSQPVPTCQLANIVRIIQNQKTQSSPYHGSEKEGLICTAHSCYNGPDHFWWFPPSRVPRPICRNHSSTQI